TEPKKYQLLLESLMGGARSDRQNSLPDKGSAIELAGKVRAGVDQLQITLGEGWRRYVQGAALWLSGLYGVALTHAGDLPASAHARYVIAALLVGGVFAWLSRDATAVIERLRR